MKTIIVVGALLFLVSPAFAENKELDRKQIFELKTTCSQAADRYEKKEIAPLRKSKMVSLISVSNAYSVRLNTCLVKQTNVYSDTSSAVIVTDVLNNKTIAFCGSTSDSLNRVEDHIPKSLDECLERVRQLMSE